MWRFGYGGVVAVMAVGLGVGAMGPVASAAPDPLPAPPAQVPCSTFDSLAEGLHNDIGGGQNSDNGTTGGLPGVREGMNKQGADGAQITNYASTQELGGMPWHVTGIKYLDGVNADTPVPGLQPELDKLEASLRGLVDQLQPLEHHQEVASTRLVQGNLHMHEVPDTSYVTVLDAPTPAAWSALAAAQKQFDAVTAFVNNARKGCAP